MISKEKDPLISVVMPTYNRADSLERAIQSVLGQTYRNIDVIVVDDGSTDNTSEILRKFTKDSRLRVIRHEKNKGVCAAKNTGFDNIRGEWFFITDSDDELLPTALEELIRIPLEVDTEVNQVTCNIIEYETNKFLGFGFDKDQYWDEEAIYSKTKGEFAGLINTGILGNDRLNENVVGREGMLWAKIRSRSKGYYIHRGLYIVHKEGDDRVCKQMSDFSVEKKANEYKEIKDDHLYWEIMEKYSINSFLNQCIRGMIIPMAAKDKSTSRVYSDKIKKSEKVKFYYKLFARLIELGGPVLSKKIFRIYNA
jgi:glycosyltransferase involved in cell wall biosynthesis